MNKRTSFSISLDNQEIWKNFTQRCAKDGRKYTTSVFKLIELELKYNILNNIDKIIKVLEEND